jgi:hypothetical protein
MQHNEIVAQKLLSTDDHMGSTSRLEVPGFNSLPGDQVS